MMNPPVVCYFSYYTVGIQEMQRMLTKIEHIFEISLTNFRRFIIWKPFGGRLHIMKCLSKYKWVKLYRSALPQGKGIMGYWARLAGRAAFRQGNAQYCGYTNTVTPGMWSGGH